MLYRSWIICAAIWRRHRSGATGTLDYVPPEAFQIDPATGSLREMSSQADLWALGLLLHQLCYFRLPYQQQDVELLRQEIESFQGYVAAPLDCAVIACEERTDSIRLLIMVDMICHSGFFACLVVSSRATRPLGHLLQPSSLKSPKRARMERR